MKIQKMKAISRQPVDAAPDIDLINIYTIKELKPEDVFVFSVVLCDNEVDRDFEVFADSALDELGRLFVGKTGIFNHSWNAKDQVARIYKTGTETAGGKNSLGNPLKQLLAYAYILRTEKNADIIGDIEGGILKEVSVGAAMKQSTCSICGGRMGLGECENGHDKGMKYEEGLCYGILDAPADAYEFSFVAVPSQRGAGVTKSFEDVAPMVDAIMQTDLSPESAKALMEHCRKCLMSEDERLQRQEIIHENKSFLKQEDDN